MVETVVGLQFGAIPKLANAHFGLFCRILGESWTIRDEQPPLPEQFEEFPGPGWTAGAAKFQLTQNPASRARLVNNSEDRMVQIQNGRLHLNWLGKGTYPRFDSLLPEFRGIWEQFQAFNQELGLERALANQWEVTYVNHVLRGSLWNEPGDWANVLPGVVPEFGMSNQPDGLSVRLRFEIPEERGRLYVELDNAADRLIFKLTARGPVLNEEDVTEGLALGREAIVTKFCEVTSDSAQEAWGRES